MKAATQTTATAALVLAALLVLAAAPARAEDGQFTLSYKNNYYYDRVTRLEFNNQPVVEWAPNQTEPQNELQTDAWLFEPSTGKMGYRYSRIRIKFEKGCRQALDVHNDDFNPSIVLMLYPYAYPSVSPNLTSSTQDLPDYAMEVTHASFNGSEELEYEFEAGELFLGFRCCVGLYVRSNGSYRVEQTNLTGCAVTVEGMGGTVLVSSLKLFCGTVVLILAPALLTGITRASVRAYQRKKQQDKSEADHKRVSWECRVFWLSWIVVFAVYIGIILVPMY